MMNSDKLVLLLIALLMAGTFFITRSATGSEARLGTKQIVKSMAPLEVALNMNALLKNNGLQADTERDFVIFHDRDNRPQKRASAPFRYGYVDLPRNGKHTNRPLLDPLELSEIIAREDTPQSEGEIKLYLDADGQPQIMHVNSRHSDASWQWDVTLPQAEEGMIVALWLFSGPAYRNPDQYQFEFDIELMGGGSKGPRIEANFHDGKGPPQNFATRTGDWSGHRMTFRIDQYLTDGYCEIFIDDVLFGRITREEVEENGRTWPNIPLYAVTDMWLVTDRKGANAKGLRNWAGTPDRGMDIQTLIVHGYEVTSSE